MPPVKTCECCGWPIVGKRPQARYCGKECRSKAFVYRRWHKRPEVRTKRCSQCSKLFGVSRKDQKFCSGRCRQTHWRGTKPTPMPPRGPAP